MSKTIVTEYNITNPKIKEYKRTMHLSDSHGEYKKLERAIELIKRYGISYVFYSGDLEESEKGSDYSRRRKIELLEDLSKVAKVVFSIGNHDGVFNPHLDQFELERVKTENYAFWSRLKNIDNLYIPDIPDVYPTISHNEFTDDIDVSTINMTPGYFWYKESKEDYDINIKTLNLIKNNPDKYNVLLTHSQKNIIRDGSIDEYLSKEKGYDLILSGHMHGGLVPYSLRNNSRTGLLGPGKKIFPENSYGVVQDGNTISMTTGGIVKVADGSFGAPVKEIPGAKQLLDVIYPPEVDIINLAPGMDNTVNKVRVFKM